MKMRDYIYIFPSFFLSTYSILHTSNKKNNKSIIIIIMKLNIQDMQRNMRLKYDLIKLSAIITCRHYITLHMYILNSTECMEITIIISW